ncbi:MAG: peptidase S41 [Saprospiraceae bacterium]|nr:peptidase S41 [Saprospiraceae bacterium]
MYPGKYSIYCMIVFCLTSCGMGKNNQTMDTSIKSNGGDKIIRASIIQKIKELDHKPVEERIALYKKLKKESPDAYNFENEDEITMYGYGFLWADKIDEAFAIFQLIVDEFGSANAYDSLAEAYLKKGDRDVALANYEKSLAMNPDNFNAEDQIEAIKHPEKKPLTPAEKFNKIYTAEAYKADLDQLSKSIVKIHPNVFKFISQKKFTDIVEKCKSQITENTKFGEFSYLCNKIIASINCAHTGMGGLYPENEMLPQALKFPIQTRWIGSQLYVIDPMNNSDELKPKDEILAINGVPVATLIDDIYQHVVAQGMVKTTKNHTFNTLSSSLIPYSLGLPEEYSLTLKGAQKPIVLRKSEKAVGPYWDYLQYCEKQLCFEFLEDKKAALLTITSFNYYSWNNLQEFVDFIDQSFREIKEKGVQNLIIDVRYNSGGSQSSAIHLLKYLVDKPFTYYSKADFPGKMGKIEGEEVIFPNDNGYNGKVLFLIDGIGNSTTGHFMSLVKFLKLGTIIGEELGSNQFCSAGSNSCRLKNTKLNYYVANNTHISTATTLPDEKGILPDHFVSQNIDDVINRKDVVKEFALGLLK